MVDGAAGEDRQAEDQRTEQALFQRIVEQDDDHHDAEDEFDPEMLKLYAAGLHAG